MNVNGGSRSSNVGGLAGANNGSITDAYALGAVTTETGRRPVGGLVGTNDGTILRTYATGLVTAPLAFVVGGAGGLVGTTTGGSIQNSFWDSDTSGQSTVAGGSPLTTSQFQDTSGFMALAGAQGWNFQTTWSPPSPGNYPELYALSPVVYLLANDETASRARLIRPSLKSGRLVDPPSMPSGRRETVSISQLRFRRRRIEQPGRPFTQLPARQPRPVPAA